jgi:hypothetical protein
MIFDEHMFDSDNSSGTDPSDIPYTKYVLEMDDMLKLFSRVYNKDDRAGCHKNEAAAELSHKISLYVRVHWRESFREQQLPRMNRKNYPDYVQEGNN